MLVPADSKTPGSPPMIAFEVRKNGKLLCIAGAEDLTVLSAIVSAVGRLGKKTVPARPESTTGEVHLSVGGLTGRADQTKDVHMRWKSLEPMQVGDVVEIRVVETAKADRATSRTKANRKQS